MHRLLRLATAIAALVGLTTALDRPLGTLPPLGRFFSPFEGAWAGAGRDLWAEDSRRALAGLGESVVVRADREGVKRIFAKSDDDLYFAQGYVAASDRLWQMDFLYRVAAGRLAEIVGEKGLAADRLFRRFGIPQAAAESAELMMQDPATKGPLARYAAGVNAYIASLDPKNYPLEFKLLNYTPEPWSPAKTAHVMKFMAFNLAAHSRELPLTRSQARLSPEDFDDLFPLSVPTPDPIVPKGHHWPFHGLAPEAPRHPFRANLGKLDPYPSPNPANGSNNWAVGGKKSSTGRPILSNDIHLDYSLPSLWYETQLSSPSQNVYGASLPGAPGVVLGFNPSLAWAVTNGGDDVLDWYELRFRDEKRREYLHEGEWRPVIESETTIAIKGGQPLKLGLKRTHYGPIVYEESEEPAAAWVPRGLAMRWAPLEASNEVRAFLALNRAKSTEACREAISAFNWPPQNFLCADGKNIGLWHNGQFPIRWRGQGRTISDGSNRGFDWAGWIPRDQIPGLMNPDRGFLSSANQAPTDASYPHYLGWPFEEPYRGIRINELLRAKAKLSPADLRSMQGDDLDAMARETLPALLKALPERASLSDRQQKMFDLLGKWDFRFGPDSAGAAIFDAWWARLESAIWSEKFPDPKAFSYPPVWRTVQLILADPASRHFDQLSTTNRETLRERAWAAFAEAEQDLVGKRGEDPLRWRWGDARPTTIAHAARIPGLGRKAFQARGSRFGVFANTGTHGPVWKLVVALGSRESDELKAWAIYPGGQSGDPASPLYDSFVDRWAENDLREIAFLKGPDSTLSNSAGTVILEPQSETKQ